MIGLIKLNSCNIGSFIKVLSHLRVDFKICSRPEDFDKINKIIFPGVGTFFQVSSELEQKNLKKTLIKKIKKDKTLFLGVCLGMQLLANYGEEGGYSKGLNILDGQVKKLKLHKDYSYPHVGWNKLKLLNKDIFLFKNKMELEMYFCHGYELIIEDKTAKSKWIKGYSNHSRNIISYIHHENIFGLQSHPEKSDLEGISIIKNFLDL